MLPKKPTLKPVKIKRFKKQFPPQHQIFNEVLMRTQNIKLFGLGKIILIYRHDIPIYCAELKLMSIYYYLTSKFCYTLAIA